MIWQASHCVGHIGISHFGTLTPIYAGAYSSPRSFYLPTTGHWGSEPSIVARDDALICRVSLSPQEHV